jgi:hypothetical protein
MPFIGNLWIATLTRTRRDSGTKSELVVIMNQNELDVVHRDLGFGSKETGGANLHRHDISEQQVLPENYYMRIGTRGADLWRPSVIAAWGERFTTGNVVPLGYDEVIETVLSTDSSEGRISLPVRPIGRGGVRTDIQRVMLVTVTQGGDAATDSPIHVRITAGESVVVDHTIPEAGQFDLESLESNVYFLPVLSPFRRSQLRDSSIVLSIEGDDAWLPWMVGMFGLDAASEQPRTMVPLVHVHPWEFGWLSKDAEEGAESVTLPLAPMDPSD